MLVLQLQEPFIVHEEREQGWVYLPLGVVGELKGTRLPRFCKVRRHSMFRSVALEILCMGGARMTTITCTARTRTPVLVLLYLWTQNLISPNYMHQCNLTIHIRIHFPNLLLRNFCFFLRFLYLCLFIFERRFLRILLHHFPLHTSSSLSKDSMGSSFFTSSLEGSRHETISKCAGSFRV